MQVMSYPITPYSNMPNLNFREQSHYTFHFIDTLFPKVAVGARKKPKTNVKKKSCAILHDPTMMKFHRHLSKRKGIPPILCEILNITLHAFNYCFFFSNTLSLGKWWTTIDKSNLVCCQKKLYSSLETFLFMIASLFYLEYICNNILIVHVVFLKLPHYCKPMKMTYSYEGKSFAMKMKFLKYWKDIPILYAFAFIHDLRGFLNVLPSWHYKS